MEPLGVSILAWYRPSGFSFYFDDFVGRHLGNTWFIAIRKLNAMKLKLKIGAKFCLEVDARVVVCIATLSTLFQIVVNLCGS